MSVGFLIYLAACFLLGLIFGGRALWILGIAFLAGVIAHLLLG